MYHQIPHTADLAYEIVFSGTEELFEDIIRILEENAEYEPRKGSKTLEFEFDGELEDFVFDVVNELVAEVESGWFPKRVSLNNDRLEVEMERVDLEKFDIKALTYHMLKAERLNGEKMRMRVVFDV